MASHKCSQGEAARVGLMSATEKSPSVTHTPLGNHLMDASGMWREALKAKGGHSSQHHATSGHPQSDTRWNAIIGCGAAVACQAVTELQPCFAATLHNSHCQTNVETTLLHTSICESPPWYLASLDMSHFKARIQWHPHPRLGDIMRQWDTLYNLNLFGPDALVHANVLFILCTWIWTLLVYVDALIQIYDTLMAAKLWMKEALSEWRDSLTMKAGCHHLIYFGLVWLW